MNALGERIARAIASHGPISVAQFMIMAMHDREHGYYATRDPLGESGDFITAPEISQMFGELLGAWCVQVWQDQSRPKPARIVELGPGRGTLMRDALRVFRAVPEFVSAVDVVMVESNPKLIAAQRETLKNEICSIRWVEEFETTVDGRPTFILANEFFDALPIRQFIRTSQGWFERMISLDENAGLAFVLSPVPAGAIIPREREGAPAGSVFEISAAATALVGTLAAVVCRTGGAALIVDYGYDVTGFGETLRALSRHRHVGIIDEPGEADLSAHVDFMALAAAAVAEGASAYGPVEQGTFLRALGITMRAERLSRSGGEGTALSIHRDLERLTAADQMGSLFKAMAILPPGTKTPPGF